MMNGLLTQTDIATSNDHHVAEARVGSRTIHCLIYSTKQDESEFRYRIGFEFDIFNFASKFILVELVRPRSLSVRVRRVRMR